MPEFDLALTLRAAASGDPAAWRGLVGSYERRVYGLLLRQCGDRELAEELTQDTFVKLVDKLQDFAGYDERGRFEPWLFRIAMNKLRDEMRRRRRQASPTDMSPGAARQDEGGGTWASQQARLARDSRPGSFGENPTAVAIRGEQVDRLLEAIASLPEADRQLLELRHTAGLSFAQIAETLDQPLGTVLARGHRAIGKLRKVMEEDD